MTTTETIPNLEEEERYKQVFSGICTCGHSFDDHRKVVQTRGNNHLIGGECEHVIIDPEEGECFCVVYQDITWTHIPKGK